MSFHTVGDSHASSGWAQIPGVVTHEMGPWTAYGFGRDGVGKFDITTIAKPGDSVCFCMGEIDCRCHVHKHVTPQFPAEWVIGQIVSDYLATIAAHQKRVARMKVFLYSVPPTVRASRNAPFCKTYPLLGSDDERKDYVRLFNEMLFYHGRFYGFLPVDVWRQYMDGEWFLDSKYSEDGVHINNPVFIIEALKKAEAL